MKSLLWKEAFNIPKDSEHSLLEILRSGFIKEDDYIQWASDTYQLPVVDHDFFKTVANFKLILENPSPLWSETFFPAHEWENTLYVVCLEPQEIQIDKPYSFVLASLFRMETLWSKMEKPEASAVPATEEVDVQFEHTIELNPQDADESIIPPYMAPEASPDFSFDSLVETPQQEPTPVVEKAPASPPPMAPAAAKNNYEDSKITSLFSQVDSSTQISIPDFIIDELTRVDDAPLYEDTRIATESENTSVVSLKSPKAEITFTTTKTILPFPDRSSQFSFLRTVFSEPIILEARGKIKESSDPHQALICAFHILKDYYKKLMWCVRDQKGAVFPIASNTAWDFSEEAWNTPIDFKSPNPFRIAKFTAKPYHGEVYKNPINDRFFELWNAGKYPAVFTITPVKLQGKVFAYFVGCEPAMHFHPTNSLDIMQATCDELIQTFLTMHKELAPKAS